MSEILNDLDGFEEIATNSPPATKSTRFLEIYDLGGRTLDESIALAEQNIAERKSRTVVCASDVEIGERRFLGGNVRLPLGEIVVNAGFGGVGKGQLGGYIMAALSRGLDFATGQPIDRPHRCLFISSEDKNSDLKERVDRAGIEPDYRNIFFVDKLASLEMGIDLSEDGIGIIESLITDLRAEFLVLDPLQAFCEESMDLSRSNHVRRCMHRLAALAERTQSVIMLFAHPNKRQAIANLNDLISGSADIVSAARSVMLLLPDFEDNDENVRLLVHTKSNHAKPAPTLRFRVGDTKNDIIGVSNISAGDCVSAINDRKLMKSKTSTESPNFTAIFYDGILDMLDRGESKMSFREFVQRYAPAFKGRPKYIFDDLTVRLEESQGVMICTSSGRAEKRINGERGFELVPLK